MNTRLIVAIAIAGGFAAGCTFIVGSKFSDTDDYKQNVNPADTARDQQCALPSSNKVAPECGKCITDSCKAEVDYACGRTGNEGAHQYFSTAESCANDPNQAGGSWSCGTYANSKATSPPNPTTESEHKQALEVCIRDRCVNNGATPACKTCKPSITAGSDTYELGKGACGSCIASACQEQLVRCCTISDVVSDLSYCAAPQLQSSGTSNRDKCLRAFSVPDAGTKSDAGTCDQDLRGCMASCKSTCSDTSKD